MNSMSSDAAAWVQAIGTIAAVVGAAWVAAREGRQARRLEARDRQEALGRERHALVSARTAALNLAILAVRQIHELHLLLRDETRRVRVARVSPSRTLLTNEHMLTAFPIQTLNDAEAMVAFAYFPGALATAAEIYANLEVAVRAADASEHAEIFAEYAAQMARLDRIAGRRLEELRMALQMPRPAAIKRPAQGGAGPAPAAS